MTLEEPLDKYIVLLVMNRSISLFIVANLIYIASLSAFAENVHKWVDEKGVTHYSDKAPTSSDTQVIVIEVPATHSTTADVENDYYSITNQWMRVYEERIALEKIKIEKAKQKAAQRPVAPQVVYLNDPDDYRYVVGYSNFFHRKHRHNRFRDKSNRRFRDKSNKHYGDKHAKHHRRGHSDKFQGQRRGHSSHSNRKSSGLTLKIH